jgi:hypothetical protein
MKSSKLGGVIDSGEDHLMKSLEDLISEAKQSKPRSFSKGRNTFQ